MDITAVYKTETAPIDLVEQQVNQGKPISLNKECHLMRY
jgi:hypothetical protein